MRFFEIPTRQFYYNTTGKRDIEEIQIAEDCLEDFAYLVGYHELTKTIRSTIILFVDNAVGPTDLYAYVSCSWESLRDANARRKLDKVYKLRYKGE